MKNNLPHFMPLFMFLIGMLSWPQSVLATSFSFGTVGDLGARSNFIANMKLVGRESVISTNPLNFFIAEGDLSYAAVSPASWCQMVKDNINIGAGKATGDAFGNNYPYQMVAGNHDDSVANSLIDDFTTCLPNRMSNVVISPNYSGPAGTTNYGKEYYFDYPLANPIARFIFISPNLTFTNGGAYSYPNGSARYNWVKNAIDSARTAGITWVIANMHENAIDMGTKSNTVGADLMNLFLSKDTAGRQRVDLILQGHDHTYQRSYGLAVGQSGCTALQFSGTNTNCIITKNNTTTKNTATVVMINGAGGNGLYTINAADTEAGYFAAWMGSTSGSESNPVGGNGTYGITKFVVTDAQINAQFIRASGGNYTDSFAISGSGGPTSTPIITPTPTAYPGDANGDRIVNFLDLSIWQNHFFQSISGTANGDFDGNSIINGLDYFVWRTNYNETAIAPLPTPTLTPTGTARTPYTTQHFTVNGGDYTAQQAIGVNLVDVGMSLSTINSLPAGMRAIVWTGTSKCPPSTLDPAFTAFVDSVRNNTKVFGYYLVDEPDDPNPACVAGFRAMADYIHTHAPGQKAMILLTDYPGTFAAYATPNSHADYIALDPYPCKWDNMTTCHFADVADQVNAVLAGGTPLSAIVPVYQTFGSTNAQPWRPPTNAELQQLLNEWIKYVPNPDWDYAYTWGFQSAWDMTDTLSSRTDWQNTLYAWWH